MHLSLKQKGPVGWLVVRGRACIDGSYASLAQEKELVASLVGPLRKIIIKKKY